MTPLTMNLCTINRARSLVLIAATVLFGGCSVHQDGSADVNLKDLGLTTTANTREPASIPENPENFPGRSAAIGQVGTPGSFDVDSVRVRDSANPLGDLQAEAKRFPAYANHK